MQMPLGRFFGPQARAAQGAWVRNKVDLTVLAVTGGLNLQDVREMLRGEEPSRRPNPRYKVHTNSFWMHVRPMYYPAQSLKFKATFGLGFMTAFAFFIETVTGIFLMIFYTPAPGIAYQDMVNIISNVPFGNLMRELHRLGAEVMVVAVWLHAARVYFTGAYKQGREFTWVTGVLLLLMTLFLSFFGYLLPWDQLAFWAVTIGTSMAEKAPIAGDEVNLLMRGARDIGAAGLLRAYLIHVFLFPVLAFIFISVHYYRVSRLHGISFWPAEDTEEAERNAPRVGYIPGIATKEIVWGILATLALVVFSHWFWESPLQAPANPNVTPLHTTAPWYFLWIQGLLKLGDPGIMGVVIPTILILVFLTVPYWDRNPSRNFRDRPLAMFGMVATAVVFVALTWMGTPAFRVPTAPAIEVAQELMPDEVEPGGDPDSFETVAWSELQTGVWDTHGEGPPGGLGRLFGQFRHELEGLERRGELPDALGALAIQSFGPGLKKVHFRIYWIAPELEPPVPPERDALFPTEVVRDGQTSVRPPVYQSASDTAVNGVQNVGLKRKLSDLKPTAAERVFLEAKIEMELAAMAIAEAGVALEEGRPPEAAQRLEEAEGHLTQAGSLAPPAGRRYLSELGSPAGLASLEAVREYLGRLDAVNKAFSLYEKFNFYHQDDHAIKAGP